MALTSVLISARSSASAALTGMIYRKGNIVELAVASHIPMRHRLNASFRPARPTPSALWDGECGDDLGFIVRSPHATNSEGNMTGRRCTDTEAITISGRSESWLRRHECAWCGQTLWRALRYGCGAIENKCEPTEKDFTAAAKLHATR